MSVCLLPEKIDAFKKALKNKDIDIAFMLDPSTTSEQRTAIFREYTATDADAKAVNTAFEEKQVLKNRILGLQNLLSKLGEFGKNDPKIVAENAKIVSDFKARQQERIFSPTENETYLNDVVDKKLGTHISSEVAAKVFELSKKAEALKEINPKMSGVSDEYLQAKQALNDYVQSQTPISPLSSIGKNAAIIARNNLLFNPATPLKTIEGQLLNSGMDLFTRRIGALSASGENPELAAKANDEAWETFRKTGINTADMESLDDQDTLGEGKGFNVATGLESANGATKLVETAMRKTAAMSNKIIIDWAHKIPYVKFYQKAFFDTANVLSSKIARSENLSGDALKARAAEIFHDSIRIQPQTKEGAIVRMEAQKQGARVTSTNDTLLSGLTMSAKNFLNNHISGLGDALMPIAKIPANIVYNGIENAGLGIFTGSKDIFEGRQKIQSEDLPTRYKGMAQMSHGIQTVARTLGVLAAAALFTSQLQKDDFRQDNYGNSFVKIGNVWINMEYISAISPALAGMMDVKKNKSNKSPSDIVKQYFTGATAGYKNLPGIEDIVNSISSPTQFFTSRALPAFIPNLLKGRPIDRLFFGASGVESVQNVATDNKLAAEKRKK